MSRVRILVAAEHALFRDALRRLLEAEPEFHVVGEAADASALLKLAAEFSPDILVLDWGLSDSFELLTRLAVSSAATRVIGLTESIDRPVLLRALDLGVRGFVSKDCRGPVLVKAIREVVAGQYWIGRERLVDLVHVLRELVKASLAGGPGQGFGLTRRECEIVVAVTEGCANKDIANRFSISEKTVKHHLTNIFDKLGVSSRLELALFARNHKLEEDESHRPLPRDAAHEKRRAFPPGRFSTH